MLHRVTPPAGLPVSVAELRAVARLDQADDARADPLLQAACDTVERYLRRALLTQTVEWVSATFPRGWLPLPPFRSIVSVAVRRNEAADVAVGSETYRVRTLAERASLEPVTAWPWLEARPDAVTIRYEVGYGAAPAVPQAIRTAILLHATALFEVGGEAPLGEGVRAILNPYREPKL